MVEENTSVSSENAIITEQIPSIDFKTATAAQMSAYADALTRNIQEKHPKNSYLETLKELSEILPAKLPDGKRAELLKLAQTDKEARQATITYFLKTIFHYLQPFFNIDPKRQEDIFQSVVLSILERINKGTIPEIPANQFMTRFVLDGVKDFYSETYNVHTSWVTPENIHDLQKIDAFAEDSHASATELRLNDIAELVSKKMGVPKGELLAYIKNTLSDAKDQSLVDITTNIDSGIANSEISNIRDVVVKRLTSSELENNERNVQIFLDRFGLNDNDELTLKELSEKYNITPERVREVIAIMMRRLRSVTPLERKYISDYIPISDEKNEVIDTESGTKIVTPFDEMGNELQDTYAFHQEKKRKRAEELAAFQERWQQDNERIKAHRAKTAAEKAQADAPDKLSETVAQEPDENSSPNDVYIEREGWEEELRRSTTEKARQFTERMDEVTEDAIRDSKQRETDFKTRTEEFKRQRDELNRQIEEVRKQSESSVFTRINKLIRRIFNK
jgi:hypothetical protein